MHGQHGLTMPFDDEEAQRSSSHHLAVVLLPEGARRNDVRTALQEERIQTSVHYPPIHGFTAYADATTRPLPHTDEVAPRLLTLPLYPGLTDDGVDLVASSLLDGLREARSRERGSSRDVPQPT